jgi:hypothetical protein
MRGLFGCASFVLFVLVALPALLLLIDVFTGQDGGVHLVVFLFFGILFVFFWGLSRLF